MTQTVAQGAVPDYAIRFEAINKRVRVLINNKSVDPGTFFDAPPANVLVPLDSALQPGTNSVKVEVFNDVQPPAPLSPWRVRYRIEIRGEPVAIVDYTGGYTGPGLVLELYHTVQYPYDPSKAPDYAASVSLSPRGRNSIA